MGTGNFTLRTRNQADQELAPEVYHAVLKLLPLNYKHGVHQGLERKRLACSERAARTIPFH